MFQFNIIEGKTKEPFKGIIYGDNGVGKNTFASHASNVLFLDLEGNASHLDAPRQPIKNYEECEGCLKALIDTEHGCKTLVLDSLDRLETYAKDYLERTYKGNAKILEYGGKTSKMLSLFSYIIELLDRLRDKKGMNIILLCHDALRPQQELDMPTYSRRELSLDPKISALFQNWSNFIFYAEKEKIFTTVESDNSYRKNNRKALRTNIDNRILRTNGHPGLLAKNTWNLPDIIELTPTPEGWNFFMESIDTFYNNQSLET